ncbi:MAG TPA: neutral/alkaline non-lysosomal ceramidase N-terminal domain-containing protein, partial [Methylococcales bacterium]
MALLAGAAQVDISPKDSQFLFGYPHVERYSTGTNDPLLSSALYLNDGQTAIIIIANDIIFVGKKSTQRIRERIAAQIGISADHIMISATHTHSGPMTVDYISNETDLIVPKTDQKYVRFMEDRIVESAVTAHKNAQPARIGLAIADSTGVGTNRRSPAGPADMNVPVLLVQNAAGTESIACMLICSMHPTVLHEDSKLVSGDFPAYARMYLQKHCVGAKCAVLHHTGPSGNQSPRHVTKANTFAEAQRLGEILGKAVEKVLPTIQFTTSASIQC